MLTNEHADAASPQSGTVFEATGELLFEFSRTRRRRAMLLLQE